MKYYILICAILLGGSVYAQNQQREQSVSQQRPEERIRALTDVQTDQTNILRNQFNKAQQQRLESVASIQERRAKKQEAVQDFIERKKDVWNNKRVQLEVRKKQRVTDLTEGAIQKLDNALLRLERSDAHIQTFITEDTPQTTVDAFNSAHALLEEAQASTESIKAQLSLELSNPQGLSSTALKELLIEARDDVQEAWESYKQVITRIQ